MIKALLFDFGGVMGNDAVIYLSNDYSDFSEVLKLAGMSVEEAKEFWKEHWPKIKTNKESVDEFWDGFCSRAKNDIDKNEVMELYNSKISAKKEMVDFVKSLKGDYTLATFANEGREWMNIKIKKFELNKIFDKIYCSAFLGMKKPDKEIYEYVLGDLNVKPEEIVYIDNQENNLPPAKELGMQIILFENLEQLKKDLAKLGVK